MALLSFVSDWLFVLLIVAVLTLLYMYLSAVDNRKKFGLPGPDPTPFLGHFPELFKVGLIDFYANLRDKYGKVVALNPGYFGNRLGTILVSDLDMLKEILVKQAHAFTDRNGTPPGRPFNKMVTVLTGDDWKQVRNTMTPTFSSGKLRQMQNAVNTCADHTVQNLLTKAQTDESFDTKVVWGAFGMDVICSTAFGVKVDSQNNPDEPFVKNGELVNKISFANPFLILMILVPRLSFLLRPILRYTVPAIGAMRFFADVTDKLIDERQQSNNHGGQDFLQLMLNAHEIETDSVELTEGEKEVGKWKRRALTRDEVIANGMVFFLAGYNTTSDTLSFASYELAMNPEIQERLQREIDDTLQDSTPTYDNVTSLQYLDQVIAETLRMYPVGFLLDRVATQDTTVNGVFVPKGTVVIVPVHAIHHDPELYPDPEKFDPERFTPEAKAKRNPYSYLPFGMGPRNCIGMRLALLEMKVVLVKALQNFTFKTCEKTELKFGNARPMKPIGGLWLKVEERSK